MTKISLNKRSLILIVVIFVFVLGILSLKNSWRLSILSTSPKNRSENISDKTNILITFNKKLSENNKKDISIKMNPNEDFQITWNNNISEIIFINPLKTNTEYLIKIFKKNNLIYEFTFKTTPFSTAQILEEGPKQSQDDLVFGEAYTKFLKEYPWYYKLPIDNDNYKIVYDFVKKRM